MITKRTFASVLKAAWEATTCTPSHMVNSFRKAGLYPLDKSVALSTFKELQPQPTPAMLESIPTHLTAAEATGVCETSILVESRVAKKS